MEGKLIMADNEFTQYINDILADYFSTCNIEPFDCQIIISDDMATSYQELRKDLVECGKTNLNDLNQYHGLTVQPKENDGQFTILINKEYILESITKHNVDWIGTLVHEAVHVNDFKVYFEIINPKSYDELYEWDLHRMFLYWTEFHARAIGHYFLRKYTLENFKDTAHLEHIMNTELPYHIEYMVNEVGATNNADRQMYVIAHFLGRIAVWQYLYPDTFDDSFIKELTNSNPWMEELYCLFTKYDTLEKIYPHFDEMEEILNKHFSGM